MWKKNIPALFFIKVNNNDCKVYTLYNTISKRKRRFLYFLRKHYKTYLINKWFEKQSVFNRKKRVRNADTSRIVIFGYIDNKRNAIRFLSDERAIKPEWFDKITSKTIAILFVPGGGDLFNHSIWSEKIKSWISFKDKFDFLVGLPILKEETKTLFPSLIEATFNDQEVAIIAKEFDAILSHSMEKIIKANDGPDMRMAAYILRINKLNLIYQ